MEADYTKQFSMITATSGGGSSSADKGKDKDNIWNSLLESVATGRRLPEKNLVVLGGSVDSQRELLETLAATDGPNGVQLPAFQLPGAPPAAAGQGLLPPVANHFALGYTYYDVPDADHEDTLARISAWTLASSSPSFAPLLSRLLTPETIPNTLVVVLLDWEEPWHWMRQLRRWVRLLREAVLSLSKECKDTMEEVMLSWRDRGRFGGINLDGTSAAATAAGEADSDVHLQPGPGEWEDALGLPLCVVCQNAGKMDVLEKTQGWKDEEFDVVLLYMRTTLLKHGASLIYTSSNVFSQLPTLVHSSLGIHSLLKKQPLKPNVIDRDSVLVPPNWDTWGKIRVLREGFEIEAVSNGWSIDIDQPLKPPLHTHASSDGEPAPVSAQGPDQKEEYLDPEMRADPDPQGSAVSLYESSVQDPTTNALYMARRTIHSTSLEVETQDFQSFLEQQEQQLQMCKPKNEAAGKHQPTRQTDDEKDKTLISLELRQEIELLPVNTGGIDVDTDRVEEWLKEKETLSAKRPSPKDKAAIIDPNEPDAKALEEFFHSLVPKK